MKPLPVLNIVKMLKKGFTIILVSHKIEEILEETAGCIIFQEQVMELANRVAGICTQSRRQSHPVIQ